MELKSLKCPNCSGRLEIEDGLDTFFCKYCGYKVILSGQSDAAYKAKSKAQQYRHEENVQERKYKNEYDKWEREEVSKAREHKRENFAFVFSMSIMVGIFLLSLLMLYAGSWPHKKRIKELREIEARIEEDIDDGDYEHAILLTNRLRLEDGYSSSDTREWNERREEYIRIIRRAQRAEGGYRFINAPFDSDDCSDYTKSQMIDLFSDAGFENIDTERVEGNAGWSSIFRDHLVEHVTIDGISDFTERDSFIEDAEIVIYYYEE